MPRTVSSREAKNTLGAVVNWVLEHDDEVIVENHGAPVVVIMPYTEYEKVRELKEADRRRHVIEHLRKLRDDVQARNTDMTPQEGDALADEIARDAVNGLVERGKARFEE